MAAAESSTDESLLTVTVSRVGGQKNTLHIPKDATIGQLKAHVAAESGSAVKLISAGALLRDDSVLVSSLPSLAFIAIPDKTSSSSVVAQQQQTPVSTTAVAPSPATSPQPQQHQPPQSAPAQPPGVDETAVSRLMELGFRRENVVAALQITHNNADMAAGILMGGGGFEPVPAPGSGDQAFIDDDEEGMMPMDLARLRTNDTFRALRQVVQANPSTLPHLLARIAENQPHFMQFITDNQAEFAAMINEEDPNPDEIVPPEGIEHLEEMLLSSDSATDAMSIIEGDPMHAAGDYADFDDDDDDDDDDEEEIEVSLSPAEQQAVRRLMDFGFSEDEALQAYIACDKNEELAANFLFDQAR